MGPERGNPAITDRFAVLGLNRVPWIDTQLLKERYLKLAKNPDSSTDLESINDAWRVLKDDVARLTHFWELETGQDIRQEREAPKHLIHLFMRLGPLFNRADRLVHSIQEAATPILKAERYLTAQDLWPELSKAAEELTQLTEHNANRLQSTHQAWLELSAENSSASRETALKELGDICRSLAFLRRWQNTLAEKQFALTPD